MTWQEFVAEGARKGETVVAIKKEVPPGSGRWMLLGFEYGKRSRKYHQKFMLKSPHWLKDGASQEKIVFISQNSKNVTGPLQPVAGKPGTFAVLEPDADDALLAAIGTVSGGARERQTRRNHAPEG